MVTETSINLIKQKAIEYLDKTFDADFYQQAVWAGVFNKDEHSSLLERHITYAQNNCHNHDLQEENGHWIFHSYVGYNCISCFDHLNLDFNQESILLHF